MKSVFNFDISYWYNSSLAHDHFPLLSKTWFSITDWMQRQGTYFMLSCIYKCNDSESDWWSRLHSSTVTAGLNYYMYKVLMMKSVTLTATSDDELIQYWLTAAEQVKSGLCDTDSCHSFLLFPSNILKPILWFGCKKLLKSGSVTWVYCICLTASFIFAVKQEKYISWDEGMGFRRGQIYWLWRLKCSSSRSVKTIQKEDSSRKRLTDTSRKWTTEGLCHWYFSSRDEVAVQLFAS